VGPLGHILSYEARPEHRDQAVANIEAFFGKLPDGLELRDGDVAEVAGATERFDRVVLDLPEPWAVLPALERVLEPGGVLCAYLPTTGQVQQLVLALQDNGFAHLESFETMMRGWHVTARSVRPDHRMQGHTGFLTFARRVGAPG
jgi:tRNA (adenine57-N1/adenine58-N1)-methyltransferase